MPVNLNLQVSQVLGSRMPKTQNFPLKINHVVYGIRILLVSNREQDMLYNKR